MIFKHGFRGETLIMKQLKRVLTIAFVILDIVLLTGGYDQNSRM